MRRRSYSEASESASPQGHRRRFVVVTIGCLVSAGLGAALTRCVPSTDRDILARRAPEPSAIPFTVEMGRLDAPIRARLVAATAAETVVQAPVGEGLAVVTAVSAAARVDRTRVVPIGSVRDRPIFVYVGSIPPWRPITPGLTGSDVASLQAALAAAGHPIDTEEMTQARFGYTTQRAVAEVYEAEGFAPVRAPDVDNPAQVQGSEPPSGVTIPNGEWIAVREPSMVQPVARVGDVVKDGPLAVLRPVTAGLAVEIPERASRLVQAGAMVKDRSGRLVGKVTRLVRAPAGGDSAGGYLASIEPSGRVSDLRADAPVDVATNLPKGRMPVVPLAALIETDRVAQPMVEVLVNGGAVGSHRRSKRVRVEVVGTRDGLAGLDVGSVRPGDRVNVNPR